MRKQEYTFIRMSPFSGKINQMKINLNWEDHEKWQNGLAIQNALPYLNGDEREFLKTGITPQEWEETFGPDPIDIQRADANEDIDYRENS